MKKQILYVDDSEIVLYSTKKILETSFPQHEIFTAEDDDNVDLLLASGAISLEQITIVCTDGHLGGGSTGWDLLEKMRLEGYNGPALYTGGTTLPTDKKALYSEIISKPFTAEELIASINKYI